MASGDISRGGKSKKRGRGKGNLIAAQERACKAA